MASITRRTFAAERQKRSENDERTTTTDLLLNTPRQWICWKIIENKFFPPPSFGCLLCAVCRSSDDGMRRKIFIFPCHQLKTVRKTFAEKRKLHNSANVMYFYIHVFAWERLGGGGDESEAANLHWFQISFSFTFSQIVVKISAYTQIRMKFVSLLCDKPTPNLILWRTKGNMQSDFAEMKLRILRRVAGEDISASGRISFYDPNPTVKSLSGEKLKLHTIPRYQLRLKTKPRPERQVHVVAIWVTTTFP